MRALANNRRTSCQLVKRCAFVVTILFGYWVAGTAQASEQRPNVVLIVADDMGYSDIGSFGGEIDTPNLDALAQQGLRFSQFYNSARCSPTRASLLTGRYPHNVQMGHLAGKRFASVDGYRGNLDQQVRVLPELLRNAGYGTHMVGKWHVAHYSADELQKPDISALPNTPTKRGFDAFYGTLLGGNNYFSPKYLFRNDRAIAPQGANYYYTDAISSEAVQAINAHSQNQSAQHPLFLYVAYTAPHWPIQAPKMTIAKYRERYRAGWQTVRANRFQKMVAQGVIQPGWTLSQALDEPLNWADATDVRWQVERMSTHAAMVDHLDQGVGQIVTALKNNQLSENTLILFLSDNGASAEDFPGAIPPEIMARLKSVIDKYAPASGEALTVGNNPKRLPGGKTTLQSIGPQWSQVSNTPFRKHKSWVHEGGVATPLVAHWPAGISVQAGTIDHTPGHVIDILPTILEAAQVQSVHAHAPGNTMDGVSLLSSFHKTDRQRGPLYFEHEGNRAVRDGKWKLVATAMGAWELYDMSADRTETRNLAKQHPERVRAMTRAYNDYAENNAVKPWSSLVSPTTKQP